MARKRHTTMTEDQLPDQGNADLQTDPLAGQPSGKAEDIGEQIVFDVQVQPDFERLDENDLKHWTNGLVKFLRGQGATVRPLAVDTHRFRRTVAEGTPHAKHDKKTDTFFLDDHTFEARMEWEYEDSPPVTVVNVNPDEMTAQREVVKEAFRRRYENSPQLAGTGDMPNPARGAALPPDQALAALNADEAQAIGLLTPATAAAATVNNPHQIEDQGPDMRTTEENGDEVAQPTPTATTPSNTPVSVASTQPPANEAPGSGGAAKTDSQLTEEQLNTGSDAEATDADAPEE